MWIAKFEWWVLNNCELIEVICTRFSLAVKQSVVLGRILHKIYPKFFNSQIIPS